MTARRDFLAFTAGAVAAKAVLPLVAGAPNPDAELISACAEYLRIQREFEAYYATLPGDMEDEDSGFAILDPVPTLVERIIALHASTPEGHLARGRCAAFTYLPHHRACRDDPDAATEDRFQAAILRDLVRLERGVA